MTVPVWQPGVEQQPDSLVRPASLGSLTTASLTNSDFELGDTDWTKGSAFTIGTGSAFDGSNSLNFLGTGPSQFGAATNDDRISVIPGQRVYVSAAIRVDSSDVVMSIGIIYYDSGNLPIGAVDGLEVGFDDGNADGEYRIFSTSRIAPANAETLSVQITGRTASSVSSTLSGSVDNVVLSHQILTEAGKFNFKAIQATTAFTGTSEPTWPTVLGGTVVDNGVTWEAVDANTVLWQALPLYETGSSEPTWPTAQGGVVEDNTITWVAETLRVQDENCPNTKEVAIVASKVFAGDKDIVAYSATVNPLDWTSANDAGYIPFGLNTFGSQDVSALGIYRSNLVVFNAKAFQMWQVDEDPANFALLDAIPVGCPYYKSLSPVSNDLVFLTGEGIRNMGIAGASTNLQAGFFGKQIDPLVKAAIAGGDDPMALYYPAQGQYWLIFGNEAFVLTMNGGKKDMSWSRYVYPSDIDDWTLSGDDLYLRSGDKVWKVDDSATVDDSGGADTAFTGEIWWPYLDFGALGVTKQMIGFDTVVDGEYSVVFGYNQNDDTHVTTSFTITDGDTIVGDIIPMPIAAPSFQMRLTMSADQTWEWHASSLYLQDWRLTS